MEKTIEILDENTLRISTPRTGVDVTEVNKLSIQSQINAKQERINELVQIIDSYNSTMAGLKNEIDTLEQSLTQFDELKSQAVALQVQPTSDPLLAEEII